MEPVEPAESAESAESDEPVFELDPIIVILTKERHARGWTQSEVGRRLGHASGQNIWLWETGRVIPTLPNLRAWAALFLAEIVLRVPVRRGRPRTNFRK